MNMIDEQFTDDATRAVTDYGCINCILMAVYCDIYCWSFHVFLGVLHDLV
jgi:hypothetical protein